MLTLIQLGGILSMLFGMLFSTLGVYKAVGGTGIITLIVDVLGIVFVIDQGVGLVFSIVGITALIGGIALCYLGFKLRLLNVASIILGPSALIVPSMILGMGYNLVAGIAANVIGYPWLATILFWLNTGE
jgi:hypothetical protein